MFVKRDDITRTDARFTRHIEEAASIIRDL